MTDARDEIFARIRAALKPLEARTTLPTFDASVAIARHAQAMPDLVAAFTQALEAVHGRAFRDPTALAAWLRTKEATLGYVDPEVLAALGPAFATELTLETSFSRARVDDYHFGITRAAGAIAESGTIILDDRSTPVRLAALAPWIHIAVVPRSRIHACIPDAISALGDDPNIIWCTGPSKTADVEGILIEGVHGPGEQVAFIVDG